MSNETQKVNIYELAKATGYSVSTVSKAVNHTGRISEKTRKLILEKAQEMNYVANYHAKALSLKKSWILAIIYSDNLGLGLAHPHFSVILENFKLEAENNGYEVTFVNRKMGNKDMSYLEFCRYRDVEGVFIANYYALSKQLPELIESGLPIVSADSGGLNMTTIVSDDFQGGELASEYLFNLGHTNIGHISGPFYTVAAQQRQKGFVNGLHKNGIDNYHMYEAHNFGFQDGYETALQLLDENKDNLPTAVFVSGDWMALGAMKAFREREIRVPEDISVIGFDNMEFLEFSTPGLTTIAQDKELIGRTAAQTLIKKIDGEEVESTRLPVKVIERETCRKIN